ncbi:MAG: hypothetical protein R2707_10750 [Acidimicrobiales bacterium]
MNPHTDQILEGLRPRMHTARVGHVRRLFAGLAVVPLLGFGAAAMAADGAEAPALQTADGAPDGGDSTPDVDLPDIGSASDLVDPGHDEAAGADGGSDGDEHPVIAETTEAQTKVLSLGPLGSAEISETDDGLDLLHADLVEGWEIVTIDLTDDGIVLIVKKGDSLKVVTISDGVRDEIDVRIEDLVFPTTTTTTTTAAPPTVITDRFTVTVEGKGSFIVEREGEKLWVGDVTPAGGFDYEVVQGEGWKVFVRFTNGEWVWYGKALINDAGEVEQHFWDEPPPFEPVYQLVEVPGVGVVKFKLWSDGLVYVKEANPAAGYGFWDYNEGAPAEVAKIDFEGEGSLWIVEAWPNDDGGLSYTVTDASPE